MAKKDLIDNSNVENEKGIVVYSLEDLMGERFGRYAKYIIQDRALPDVRDGLKPVQRRILYAMNDLNLTHDKAYKKSARVVGEVIGKYHPHGDTSIYDAMVRMSQWWKLNMPLIDMQGNNGSIDGDSAAAMRYTETRLEKISKLLLDDLEKETVTFIPNFDDSEKEPAVLPSYFPNILTNGSVGIAAGYSTNIPPHNLAELIDATIRLIKNPNTRLDTILELVHGPDFPTGGTVQGREGIIDAFKTGRGKVILSAKWHEEKGNIVIDEIPYEVVKQDLIIKIGDVIDANQGLGIKEVRDETDRNGIRVVIELSDKANFETVRKFLFKNTPLSVSYNYNNVVIVDKQPRLLGIIDILNAYIAHYKEIFTKKTVFDLNKSKKRLEIVSGLIKAMSILDQVIELIRKSENKQNAIENLVNKFAFTTQQATAIVEMRLYRLTSTDVVKLNQEKTDLDTQIKLFESILNDENILNTTIIDRLKQVKKDFGIPRRTEVNEIIENLSVEHKDVIVEKRFTLWISRDGYLKGIDNIVLAKNEPETFARKANDIWINKVEVSNLEHLLLITNKGTYFSFPLYKLPMSKWKENGVHINTIATMEPEELIIASFVVPSFDQATQQIMLCTKNGAIKRTPIVDFETKIFTKSFRIMKLIDDDEVVSADLITSKTNSCVIVTKQGFAVQYHLEDVPIQGTNSKGVKAANIKESDEIIAARALENEQSIAILTERGGIKKVDKEKIPLFIRPKRGSRILPERKRGTEYITHAFAIQHDDVIKLIQHDDSYYEVPVSKYRRIEMESPANELGITNFTDASLEKNYQVINGDYPISSNNAGDEGSTYVSRAEMRAKAEANKGKVSSKVVVTKQLKAEAEAKVENIKGSDLSDLLGDISSLMQNFNTPKEDKNKVKKEKDKEENIQLDFDDLFD